MVTSAFVAHLHAILAADSPSAILIKRGPQNQTGTIGWDRRTDSFTAGQCLRKKIEHREADLSPDGKYFIYYVNDQSWSRKNHVYRAISLAPWLKALVFWGSEPSDYGPGVGMFFQDEDGVTRIRGKVEAPAWDHLRIPAVPYDTDTTRWRSVVHPDAHFFTKLQRDGWIARTPWEICPASEAAGEASWRYNESSPHRIIFEKRLTSGWALRQTCWSGLHDDMNRGISWETFALVSPTGELDRRPSWEWADVDSDQGRMVWTEDCVLHAAGVSPAGLDHARPLLDTRSMVFERLIAPY